MPNVLPPEEAKKERRRARKEGLREREKRIRELEGLLEKQTKRAQKWRAKYDEEAAKNLEPSEKKQDLPSMVPIVAVVVFQAVYAKVLAGPSDRPHKNECVG